MVTEMTIQFRVSDFDLGLAWYTTFLGRAPDFIPHEGFAEWEVIPGSWLQIAEGVPTVGSGPLRIGVELIENERERMRNEADIAFFEIEEREEVPVKWATFQDPWGNRVGYFQYKE